MSCICFDQVRNVDLSILQNWQYNEWFLYCAKYFYLRSGLSFRAFFIRKFTSSRLLRTLLILYCCKITLPSTEFSNKSRMYVSQEQIINQSYNTVGKYIYFVIAPQIWNIFDGFDKRFAFFRDPFRTTLWNIGMGCRTQKRRRRFWRIIKVNGTLFNQLKKINNIKDIAAV